MAVGFDVEDIAALPRMNDFREEEFYRETFAPTEIASCILQPDPYASFAGLFACKEAVAKACNSYQNRPFSSIIIDHLPYGRPVYDGFHLSISHTTSVAVAVAVHVHGNDVAPIASIAPADQNSQSVRNPSSIWTAVFAVVLSIVA
ncbi:MAG: 4'-phosphopantetheinyl transferase superfamily protein [Gammaproteobacteria bacterium]